ncbi:hypothetical protein [Roseicyclus amphidinii]|uniref:hypothetical protein n=1 Tax=Roseicyclus amphidinii TaxID=3034232 RepID=UPI0024E1434D|nr:hypothetical protein [Roseicyclus sp. Amp-Y-6]
MRFFGIVITALAIATSPVSAQDIDLTDLTRYEIIAEGEEARTLSDVEALEDAYQQLINAGDCDAAIPAIIEFYEAANIASNLIRRGNEPYYDARREDQESVARNRTLLDELISAERVFNTLLEQRNRAWVEEAKCLLETGERGAAVTRLYRALDYISTDERELWEEARRLLWAEVGFQP